MFRPERITAVQLFVIIVAVASCNRGQALKSDTASPAPVDHASMTAEQHAAMHGGDSTFASMQSRGQMAMGVDQHTSAHKFNITADGGRIELQREIDDSLGVAQIRAHMKLIQHAFQAGDFSTPGFVHARAMPGTALMTRKKNLITYTYSDLPRGGAVRLISSDPEAVEAIREFLMAQRAEHHAGGDSTLSH